MRKYWPNLKPAKGFLIKRIEKGFEKMISSSLEDKKLIYSRLSLKQENFDYHSCYHWANRGFEEYKEIT